MINDDAWVEVRVWTKQGKQGTKLRFRGKLKDLNLDRGVERSNFGERATYQPSPEQNGTLHWTGDPWKMDRGAPKGFRGD